MTPVSGNEWSPALPERAETLDLTHQDITFLRPSIGRIDELQTLRLGRNLLSYLPPEIGQLSDLRTLNLDHNRLTELPPEIGQLTNLHTLTLDGNQLTSLPREIGQLTNLQTLTLDLNRMTYLPPEISRLTNLRTLKASRNQLSYLPPELGQLGDLRTLNLDHNRLTELPPETGQLKNLQALALDGNQLTSLPREIGQLTNLHTLTLDGNQLTSLPREIGQLTNLQTLTLDLNRMTYLPPEIGRLANLRTLKASGNRLSYLPPEIGQLANLERLALDGNLLSFIPREIGQLTSLGTLALENNQLAALPGTLADLVGRLILRLDGNPLREPLPTVLERDAEALASYLRSLDGAIPQYEAKVVLVGEGNVGKTSLVAALQHAPFVPDRPTTHGIEVESLTLEHPELKVNITIWIWDFGGQEVYRITHQFFFSPRALYLVVWNAREGQEQNEVEGWLRRIRLRVKQDARALVVATHCDERRPELDYPQLKQAFPQLLVGQYDVDNFSGNGIADLYQGIAEEASKLPQMGQLISPRWIAARDEILAITKSEPQIPYEQFSSICLSNQVIGDEIITLAKLMHDLGYIVYYEEDEGLRDFVVLDPEWLTKAISYVLEDVETRRSKGELDHSRLQSIWQDRKDGPTYASRYHPYFLRLMEKFDVSYRLEGEYRSLVAQLVPGLKPDLPWDISTALPDGIRSLSLVCELSEPVPGLIAWLTVRHHRSSIGKHWRKGVFLRYPITAYASEALIELQTPEQLVIDVRAPSPELFFNVLRDSVENLIVHRWPGLSYRLLVPCKTRYKHGGKCTGTFPLNGLLQYRERGGTHYPCLECGTDHDLYELLTGFAQPDMLLQTELEQLRGQVAGVGRDIISMAGGISKLEGYAAETADSVRRVLRVVGSEINDCPRLFSLTETRAAGVQRIKRYQRHYRLTLWCEDTTRWHPWLPASYELNEPIEWLARIGPYAALVFKALQLVVPITASIVDVVMTEAQLKHAQEELEMMKTLVEKLPTVPIEEQREFVARESANQLTFAQDEAARALRTLIFKHDHMRAFGGLRRVQTAAGDFLWVCAKHYTEYDPGLPTIVNPR